MLGVADDDQSTFVMKTLMFLREYSDVLTGNGGRFVDIARLISGPGYRFANALDQDTHRYYRHRDSCGLPDVAFLHANG